MTAKLQEPSAFDLLKDIEQRSLATEASLPKDEDKHQWSGVGFRLGDFQYVAPLEEVIEVLPIPRTTRIPGTRPWMLGVVNQRGTLMTVVDLQGFLGRTGETDLTRKRLLVVEQQGVYVGVMVDEAMGLRHFDDTEVVEDGLEAEAELAPYILGAFERRDVTWRVFSLKRLIGQPEFIQVAQ